MLCHRLVGAVSNSRPTADAAQDIWLSQLITTLMLSTGKVFEALEVFRRHFLIHRSAVTFGLFSRKKLRLPLTYYAALAVGILCSRTCATSIAFTFTTIRSYRPFLIT